MSTIEGSTKITTSGLKIHIDFSNKRCYSPNMMNYSCWTTGSGSINENLSLYGISGYELNGSTEENIRVLGEDPFGNTNAIVWRSNSIDGMSNVPPPGNDGDGGWNSSTISIDSSKMYRFSIWMKKNNADGGSGRVYFGHNSYTKTGSMTDSTGKFNSFQTTNTYFNYPQDVNIPYLGGVDTWSLVVGHIWPSSTVAGTIEPGSNINNFSLPLSYSHPDSGIWTKTSGKVGNLLGDDIPSYGGNATDWVWNSNTVKVKQRAYLYYSNIITSTASFIYPRIDLVTGYEPNIKELLQGVEPVRNLAENGTIWAKHQTNWSTDAGGCLKLKRDNFMGMLGTMSSSYTLRAASIWFKLDTDIVPAGPPGIALMALDSGMNSVYFFLGSVTGAMDYETILIGTALGQATGVENITITSGVWHQLLINWETDKYAIYLDGVSQTTTKGTNLYHLGAGSPRQINGNLTLGGRINEADNSILSMDGAINKISVWSRSLTSSEIAALYTAEKPK